MRSPRPARRPPRRAPGPGDAPRGARRRRTGAALLLAIVVASLAVLLTVALMDATRLRVRAAGNTRDYEVARYLAEAGLHRGLCELEQDIEWRAGLSDVAYPPDLSGLGLPGGGGTNTYSVTATDGPDGTVELRATGTVRRVRGDVTRALTATIKQGG